MLCEVPSINRLENQTMGPLVEHNNLRGLIEQLLTIIEKENIQVIGFRFAIESKEEGIQSVHAGTLSPELGD